MNETDDINEKKLKNEMLKKSIFTIWTYLIIGLFIFFSILLLVFQIDGLVILAFHIPSLVLVLVCQRLYHKYQLQICGRCYIQREFHNRIKYPDLTIVCDSFEKGKFQ